MRVYSRSAVLGAEFAKGNKAGSLKEFRLVVGGG